MEHPIQKLTKGAFTRMINDKYAFFGYSNNYEPIRISALIYEELRAHVTNYLEDMINQLEILKDYQNNKNITENDVLQMLHFVPGMIPRLKHCSKNNLHKIPSKIRSTIKELQIKINKLYREREMTPAIRDEIRSIMEQMNDLRDEHVTPVKEKREEETELVKAKNSCFYFYPSAFRKLIDIINPNFTYTDDAYLLIQFDVEYYLNRVLENAMVALHHAKRDTIMPRDIQLGNRIMIHYERMISVPRFVYPISNVSFREEYIKLSNELGIKKDIDKNEVIQLDRFNHLLINTLIQNAHAFSAVDNSHKITKKALIYAARVVIQGELFHHAVFWSEGEKSEKGINKPKFNIKTNFSLDNDAAVFLNTVIEYMTAELLDLMNGFDNKEDLKTVLENDREFSGLNNRLGFVPIKMT